MTARFFSIVGLLGTVATLAAAAAPTTKPVANASASPAAVAAAPVELTKQQLDFFETKVRPVLADRCYKCHSVESGKNKGSLVLDSRDGWLKGGEHGPEVIPGDPANSRLIKAIGYSDPDLQMPPKGEKLSAKEIAALTDWVKMGAPDPRTTTAGSKLTGLNDKARGHWAYQPVTRPAVPAVQNKAWVRTPVDAFILAKLEQNGMHPSPPASKEALIRRATYDLIGLPPTPEEVRAFVNDRSADAFEKVVDRLLASPHYGERWGRFWLDSARYSDTSGIENARKDDYRYAYAWTYRDYVIEAFNNDKPYDQFLREQLAADQLPDADQHPDRLAALGFLTVGKRFQNPNDQIDERIDTIGKSMLAMTVACARCHDHKFDPIPQADYYSLHGILTSTVEPADKPLVGKPPSGPEYEDFKHKLEALEAKNREIYYDLVATKSAEFRKNAGTYLLVSSLQRKNNKDDLTERNRLISEYKLDRDLYQGGLKYAGKQDPVFVPLIRFAQLPPDKFEQGAPAILREAQAGGNKRLPVNPIVAKAFKELSPDALHGLKDVTDVYGKLFASIDAQAKAYLDACRHAKGKEVTGFDRDLVELFDVPAKIVPAGALDTDTLRALAPRLPVVNAGAYGKFTFAQINELELTHPGAPGRAMVVEDAPNPRNSYVFIRGQAQNRGPVVPRRFLEILAGPDRKNFTKGSGRLELAEAIASRDNPLTARVAINRLWMHHFGEGFVRTPDDLGVQSEPPSHPELLDYLASRFVEEGWSFKHMHKLVMLSSAYQQSSDTNPQYAQKDPGNRLLWRANLRRLDFEAVRDTLLQFTGKLDPTVGGKPVNLTDEPYSDRRSVYGYIDRGQLPELMSQFDFPDPDMANSRRATTIVPQQALFFMNSPMSVDVARKVTSRAEFLTAKDDAGRVKALYEVLYQRPPRAEEIRLGLEFFRAAQSNEAEVASARQNGNKNRPDGADRRRDRLAAANKTPAKPNPGNRNNGRRAIQNEGEMVERKALTPWEEYAQALLFTNEIAYVN